MKEYFPIPYHQINIKVSKSSILFYLVGCIAITAIYLQPFVTIAELTKDTTVVTGGKFYHGLLSNIGLFFWCATAAFCYFTYFLLNKIANVCQRKLLLAGALLSTFLLLDDFLLLHELVFPRYLGLSENYLFAFYPLLIGFFLIYFLKEILSTQVILLFSALSFLAFSMITDKLLPQSGPVIIIEDGFKFLGIIGWFSYFSQTCIKCLKYNLKIKKKRKKNSNA